MNDSEPIGQQIDEGEVGFVDYQDFVSLESFHFESGGVIPELKIRYETYGQLNQAKDNAILICHALTGDHHCAGVYDITERKRGWWNFMVGPGKPINTNQYFVICSNVLGGCQGSTGPNSINPETGKRYNLEFPKLTLRDMVKAQSRLIDSLGIDKLHAVIGGSMGGMLTLQWAKDFPNRLNRYIALASGSRHTAQTIAFNETGRQAIMRDAKWNKGEYDSEDGPFSGLSVARMMAHITYLSDESMKEKFGRDLKLSKLNYNYDVEFQIESYLRYQGEKFVSGFDANTYLLMTKSLDYFDPIKDMGDMFISNLNITNAKFLVISFTSDWRFPPIRSKEIVKILINNNKRISYSEINADGGHDAFLMNNQDYFDVMKEFIDEACNGI